MIQYLYTKDDHIHILREESPKDVSRMICDPVQFDKLAFRQLASSVEVCSYNFMGDYNKLEPNDVLEKMRNIPANSFGGWRELTDDDLAIISLATTSLKELHPNLVVMHPAYRVGVLYHSSQISVVPTMGLLKSIYDIRQFVDETGKPQIAKFRHHFRLANPNETFETIKVLKAGPQMISQLTVLRSRLICLQTAWGISGATTQESLDSLLKSPCSFLHREYFAFNEKFAKMYDEETAHGLSVWKVSQRFALFLWKINLASVGLGAFEPEKFFRHQDEIDGFNKYLKSLNEQEKETANET